MAAPMAAVAIAGGCCRHHHHQNCVIVPAPSIGGSNKGEPDASSSCFRQLFTLRVHPLPSIQSVRTWATRSSALFSRPSPSPSSRRYSRLTTSHHNSSGGISSVVGKGLLHPDQVSFMIHKLMCVCKGDRRRRQNHKVCFCLDKASEDNVGLQVSNYVGSLSLSLLPDDIHTCPTPSMNWVWNVDVVYCCPDFHTRPVSFTLSLFLPLLSHSRFERILGVVVCDYINRLPWQYSSYLLALSRSPSRARSLSCSFLHRRVHYNEDHRD